MDEETKIFHFKLGILPQADLETVIALNVPKETGTFSDYVMALATQNSRKNDRKKLFAGGSKQVSGVNKGCRW